MMTLAMVLCAGLSVSAQDGERRGRGEDPRINRLKEQLNLTEEQTARLREIYQKNRESEDQLEKERMDKIREILTDEQKTQFEEFRNNPGRGMEGQGQRGMGGRGATQWVERFLAPSIDQLRKDLDLTDEQADKVKGVLDEFSQEVRARLDEMRQNGFQGMNWQEEGQKFQQRAKDLGDKLKQHLNDDQKAKVDKLLEDRFNTSRFMPGAGGRRGADTPTGDRARPRPSVDERVRAVMEALKIENGEDAAAVRDAVKASVETSYAVEDFDREMRQKLEDLSRSGDLAEDDVKARLEEMRSARKEKEKAMKDAQRSLLEIVSYRQEAELLRQGLVR